MYLRQVLIIGFFSLALLQSSSCPSKKAAQANQNVQTETTPPKAANDKQKGDKEKMDLLEQKVLNKDPSAVNVAKMMGSSAIPVLKPLAKNSDEDVRLIAVSCLGYTGGEEAANILIDALTDDSPSVAIEAGRALQRNLSPAIYSKLLDVYDKVEDPLLRREIALMLGRIEGANVNDLKQKSKDEKAAEAKEGLMVAMAKLGDSSSRTEFISRLQSAKDRELKRFLDYVEYIGQTWAVRELSPVLSDKSPLVRVGTDDPMPGEIEYLRACDIALNLIVKITEARFSFKVDGNTNYSDAQLQEARQYLTTLR